MNIGLDTKREGFRSALKWLLPSLKDTDPNSISLSLVPLGLIGGLVYFSASGDSWLYLVGAIIVFLRIIIQTLDGLVAVSYDKGTVEGKMIHRISPRAADLLILLGVIFSIEGSLALGILAITILGFASYVGLVSLMAHPTREKTGPTGEIDLAVALIIASLLQLLFGLSTSWMMVFLWWCIIGGLITVGLRLKNLFLPDPHTHI